MADSTGGKAAKSKPDMPPATSSADTAAKPRGPVNYLAFAELAPGWWALVAADREASSVHQLRKELRVEIGEAQEDAGVDVTDATRMVIIPADRAYVVEAVREVTVRETFHKVQLDDAAVQPLTSMVTGPAPSAGSEADVSARMAAGPAPPDAPPQAAAAVAEPEPGAAAAAAALAAEAGARAAQVPPGDPDDEDDLSPDTDPRTGTSRRTAAQATPADEGRTVFPIDGDL